MTGRVEPTPEPRLGRVIVLNGASSSGKTTLARALQAALDEPFLHVASDALAAGAPTGRGTGAFAWWTTVRPRLFDGFHRSVAALAAAGNDVVVDHLLEFAAWRSQLAGLLSPFDVFLIGVHCDLPELERRELERGDRRLGEGREHVVADRIHDLGAYDLDVDTTGRDPAAVATEVLAAWRSRSGRSALFADESGADAAKAAWYRGLPAKRVGAGLLLRDARGRVLLVEPTYKERWEVPGGLVEPGEAPRAAAAREVQEELGLDLPIGRLVTVDWVPPRRRSTDGLMLLFDGGVVDEAVTDRIVLPPDELGSWRWVATGDLGALVHDRYVRRLAAALEAARSGGTADLEDGWPT